MSERDADLARIDDALRVLGEHFDSVQIFTTRVQDSTEGGGTVHCAKGTGDWFARFGHCKMWCLRNEGIEVQKDKDHLDENP